MQPEEMTTFDQARAVFERYEVTVEKATEPKIWVVGGVQRLDKGGVIQAARALLVRNAALQESPTPTAPVAGSTPVILPIRQIRRDGGTQSRAGIDEATVQEYAEAMLAGAIFPAVKTWFDGTDQWLEDGFQRLAAAERIGRTTFAAEVRQGTRRDAVLASCGANAHHGLRRTDADKERAVLVLLQDTEWRMWSYREIGRRCHVSHDFVRKVAERHGLTGRASSEKTYTTRHGTTATMQTATIAAANTARAQEEPADPPPGEIHPLIAAILEPQPARPAQPQPAPGIPATPPVIELPVQLLTTGWQINRPTGSAAVYVAQNPERGVSTQGFVQLGQVISAAEQAQELIDEIEAEGWTIRRDLADPRRLRATHPRYPTITGAASLAALHHLIPAMRDQPTTPAPALGSTATSAEDTDIGAHLAALEAHGWRWHGATFTAEGWLHLIADRAHADLARQRVTVAGIANLLRMFGQTASSTTAAPAEPAAPASERPARAVPGVLVLANQPDPYVVPEREILTVLYHTAEMIAGRRADDTTGKRRQEGVYCLPDEAARERVELAMTRYQATLTAIANHLRSLGTYESRLAAAGGSEHAPNPLTPTVISAPDPDGYHAPSFDHGLAVPRADRSVVVNHTPKMLRIEGSAATISGQQGYFVCPDDASWEQLQQLRADATEAHAVLLELLAELGTYQQARVDGRYGQPAEPALPRPEPAIPWPDLDRHTEGIRRQIAQRSQAGVIRATLDLLRQAKPGAIVMPLYPPEESRALVAEIQGVLPQLDAQQAPQLARLLRAIQRRLTPEESPDEP